MAAMAGYQITPKITYENSALITGDRRKQLKIPDGIPAFEPIRLNFGEMSRKEPSKVPAPAGLTVSAIDVEAPGVTRAPAEATSAADGGRRDQGSRTSREWMFSGGEIKLNILISVYIIDQFADVPKLLKIIMEHEYLHVRDNLKLAADIGKKIENDDSVKRWLNGERWTGSAFFDRIATIWATEAKRLGNVLDHGPSYDHHKREIARLMPR